MGHDHHHHHHHHGGCDDGSCGTGACADGGCSHGLDLEDADGPVDASDERWQADRRFWQFKPIRVQVDADAFVGVQPFLPAGVLVEREGEGFVIHGEYGIDLFRNHAFKILVDGEMRMYSRFEDIPEVIDNVVSFMPDDTHDITLTYTFVKDGVTFTHSHWIHHDMDPWVHILQQLLTRETNGGWNARSDALRRQRHHALLRNDPSGLLPDRVRGG